MVELGLTEKRPQKQGERERRERRKKTWQRWGVSDMRHVARACVQMYVVRMDRGEVEVVMEKVTGLKRAMSM